MDHILLDGLKSSLLVGLFYGIGTIGLSLIYRYLRFPDFSTFMSINVGGLVCVQIVNNLNSIYGLPLGFVASIILGGVIGLATGLQIVYCKIPPILAGIITWTASKSLAFLISNGEADLYFAQNLRDSLDYFVNNIFSIQSLAVSLIICSVISFLISRIFKTRFGLMIFALLGSENYLRFRHKEKGKTTILLIMLGNAIICFSGVFIAIQNNGSGVENNTDYIYIALGGFALTSFIIKIFSKKKTQEHAKDDSSAILWVKPFLTFIIDRLQLNDEHPSKILATFMLYIFSSTTINVILKTVEIEIGTKVNFVIKAIILFVFIWLGNLYQTISKKN